MRFSKDTTNFQEFEGAEFPYLEIAGVALGSNSYKTVSTNIADAPSRARMKTQVNDIVVSTTRPHRGAIAKITEEHIIASTGFAVLRELDRRFNRDWLVYALLSQCTLLQFLQRSSGGNYPAIVEAELKQVYLPLISVDAQQQMVNQLIGKRDVRNKKLKQSTMLITDFEHQTEDLCSLQRSNDMPFYGAILYGKLDGVIDVKRYLTPKGDCPLQVSDVCNIVEEKINISVLGCQTVDWIRIDDLPNKPLEIETIRTQSAAEIQGSFFLVQAGDILVARLGPTILNQKIVLVQQTKRTTIASAEFLVLRCKLGFIPEAVMSVLKTPHFSSLMYAHSRGSTPSRYRLNREDMLKLPFPDITGIQSTLASQAISLRKQVKALREEAEQEWQAAKAQFEKELLGDSNGENSY